MAFSTSISDTNTHYNTEIAFSIVMCIGVFLLFLNLPYFQNTKNMEAKSRWTLVSIST